MLFTTLRRAGLGFLLGLAFGAVFSPIMALVYKSDYLFFSEQLLTMVGSEPAALLVQMLACGLYGSLAIAGVSFYEIESWGLLQIAVVHCSTIVLPFPFLANLLGWGDPSPWSRITFMGIQVLVYTIVFLIMDAQYRREVDQLNELLEERGAEVA